MQKTNPSGEGRQCNFCSISLFEVLWFGTCFLGAKFGGYPGHRVDSCWEDFGRPLAEFIDVYWNVHDDKFENVWKLYQVNWLGLASKNRKCIAHGVFPNTPQLKRNIAQINAAQFCGWSTIGDGDIGWVAEDGIFYLEDEELVICFLPSIGYGCRR